MPVKKVAELQDKHQYIEILSRYLPDNSTELIADWISNYQIYLKITGKRVTKFGDYRPPAGKYGHRITINHDLNPFAFLITLVHEIAHLVTWKKYNKHGTLFHKARTVKPHGIEWKKEYNILMQPFINRKIFPTGVLKAIIDYMDNPYASSCSDIQLMRELIKHDRNKNKTCLEDLSDGAIFSIRNGRNFCKGEKLRKRYKCKDITNKKIYLFNPLTEVTFVEKQTSLNF